MDTNEHSVVQSSRTGRFFALPGNWRGIEAEYPGRGPIRVERVVQGADVAEAIAAERNRLREQQDSDDRNANH
jgi:hypothetical protein